MRKTILLGLGAILLQTAIDAISPYLPGEVLGYMAGVLNTLEQIGSLGM